MKANIADLNLFVEDHASALDKILLFQSELSKYRYEISEGTVRRYDTSESVMKEVSKTRIDNCGYFSKVTKDAIYQIVGACPEYTRISISSSAVRILFRQNEIKNTVLFLCNYYVSDLREEKGGYCERIDDTWNALIYYTIPG